jgi:tetratricopeptide (TPR) repeat protein
LEEARDLSRTGGHSAVVELLKERVLADPDSTTETRLAALELLGVSHELLGEDGQAADAFLHRWLEIVGEIGSDELPAVREAARVATVMTRSGRYEEARLFWRLHLASAERGGLSSYIDRADVYYGIARAFAQEGDANRAVDSYQRALDLTPEGTMQRAVVLTEFASLLSSLGRDSEAVPMRLQARAIRESTASEPLESKSISNP